MVIHNSNGKERPMVVEEEGGVNYEFLSYKVGDGFSVLLFLVCRGFFFIIFTLYSTRKVYCATLGHEVSRATYFIY